MAIDQDGLSLIWDRMRAYVAAHIGSPTASVPVATATRVGVVRPDGTTITIDEDGTIHSTAQSTDAATTSRYGVVKYDGESISENESGQICVTGYEDLVSAVDNLASRLSDVEEMLSLVAYDSGMIVFPTNDVMQGEVIVGGEYDNGTIQY